MDYKTGKQIEAIVELMEGFTSAQSGVVNDAQLAHMIKNGGYKRVDDINRIVCRLRDILRDNK